MSRIAAFFILNLLSGCVSLSTVHDGPIESVTIYRSQSSGIVSAETFVLYDDASWSAIWATRLTNAVTPPPAPKVDFSTKMLVGVGIGTRSNGCYSVVIEKVRQFEGAVTVEYKEGRPGFRAICTHNMTHPVHIVAIPRSVHAVKFVDLTNPPSEKR